MPQNFKERPDNQTNDPMVADAEGGHVQPAEAVIATDGGGKEETVQKDVDGVLTTPPWDKNEIDAQYEYVTVSGDTYQILISNTVRTPDGTIYVYSKHGYCDGGQATFGGTNEYHPSNVLKIDTVTDRQGNVTTYTYTSTPPNLQPGDRGSDRREVVPQQANKGLAI